MIQDGAQHTLRHSTRNISDLSPTTSKIKQKSNPLQKENQGPDTDLNIFHQNIQCLKTSISELEALFKCLENAQDILCISEHWMKPQEVVFTKIEGYQLISCFARTNSSRGGTCIFAREDINDFDELELFKNYNIEGTFEMSAAISEERKIIVGCIYRSCLGSFKHFYQIFEIILKKTLKKFKSYKIIWVGDFNINFIKQNSKLTREEIKNRDMALDLLGTFNFKQTIFDITRPNQYKESCIDNIFVNMDEFSSNKVIKNGIGDHHAQIISIKTVNCRKKSSSKFSGRTFSENKIAQFKEKLGDYAWDGVYLREDVDSAYDVFAGILSYYLNLIFPVKIKQGQKRTRKSWITMGIRTSIKHKRTLYELYLTGQVSKQHYKNYSNLLKKTITNAKKLSQNKEINSAENKTKATWNAINRFTKTKPKKKNIFENFNQTQSSDFLDHVNDFFLSACPNINKNTDKNIENIKICEENFCFQNISPREVEKIILSLKNKNSVGIDEIPTKVLKAVAASISEPLTYITNLAFKTGVFPSALKCSIVRPLYKNKGEKNELKNYRPISLLNNMSKIFEKAIHIQVVDYLENQNILTKNQNGFRKGKSTIRAVYQILEHVIESLNNKKITATVSIDLSKAFDSVDHKILLKKLDMSGIRNIENRLFQSYLDKRKQCVEEATSDGQKIRSNFKTIEKGVPQGSVLAPLLYILYTNDITNVLTNNIILFADDKTVLYQSEDKQQIKTEIKNDLTTLEKWFEANNLMLNKNKTQIIEFRPKKNTDKLSIEYDGEHLEAVEEALILGVRIDKNLNWEAHVEGVAAQMSKYCYALRLVSENIGVGAALTSFHAYVQSRVRYGVILWGNSMGANRILKLQKRCLRTVLKINRKESCKELFIKHKIQTVYNLYIFESIKFLINNPTFFNHQKRTHEHNTRQKDSLKTSTPHFSYLQKNVTFTITKIWNSLPQSFRKKNNKTIEIQLKKFLETKSYYDVQEYLDDETKNTLV